MDSRKKGVILSYLYTVVQIVVNIIYVPILINILGDNEYGLYQLVASIIAYLSVMETGLSAAVLRFYCLYKAQNDKDKMENLLAIAKIMYWGLSIIVSLIGIIFIFVFQKVYFDVLNTRELYEAIFIFLVFIANIIISINNYIYIAVINANERFSFLKILGILSITIQPLLVIIIASEKPYAISVVMVQVSINIVISLIRKRYALHKLDAHVVLHKWDRSVAMCLLGFSMQIFMGAVADQIFWKVDQLILGKIYGTAIVTVYSVGAQIYNSYFPIGNAISSVFMSRVSELYNNKKMNEISELFIKVGRITLIILGLVITGFLLYGKEFIIIWVGEKYMEAYYVAIIIMLPYTIELMQSLGLTILQVCGKYRFRSYLYLISAIINIILTWILTLKMGMIGAAISTALSISVTSVVIMNIYYKKVVEIDILSYWRNIIPILYNIIIITLIGNFLKNIFKLNSIYYNFGINVIIYTACYFLIMYFFVFNKYEKNLIFSVVNKIRKR